MNYAAYGSRKGHFARFETDDRTVALNVAAYTSDLLATSGFEKDSADFFAEYIDEPNLRTVGTRRLDGGDFAVSAALADDSRLEALRGDNIYLVIAETRNTAREIATYNGPERLQAAFTCAVELATAQAATISGDISQ